MWPTIAVAIIGAVATTIAAAGATWTGLRQRDVDRRAGEAQLVSSEMRTLLDAYRSDNAGWRDRYSKDTDDLRARMATAEQRVTDLTAQVTRCEADKAVVEARVNAQEHELDALRRRVDDTTPP